MNRLCKKWLAGFLAVCILAMGLLIGLPKGAAEAAEPIERENIEGRLITVGGKTVTETMNIQDVQEMFGEPKLVTPSYWGGRAYTFYGPDYSDYLYLETYSDGSIACYGSISEGFETNTLSYGMSVTILCGWGRKQPTMMGSCTV